MRLSHIAVHDSVAGACPPDALADALDGLDLPVAVLADDPGAGTDGGSDANGAAEAPEAGDHPVDPVDSVGDGDLVVTFAPREAFHGAAWVHVVRAGYDAFDVDAYEAAGTALTNSSGIHGTSVPETVVGYFLALARRLHVYRDAQAERRWHSEPYETPFTVAGERCCVVGLGTIGSGIAERANALEMAVVGVRRSDAPVPGVRRVYPPDDLEAAVADARFVALATPLTPETRGMVDESVFAAMRSDAYLVNVSRGPIVDQDALVEALDAGELAGAALDVFEEEPLPADSPLWDREDVLVTPHASPMTNRYHADVAALVRENVERLRADEALRNRVA